MNVDDLAAIDYTIENIAPEIEFTIEMWAYLDLPSSSSNPTTIYLNGENPTPTQLKNIHITSYTHYVLNLMENSGRNMFFKALFCVYFMTISLSHVVVVNCTGGGGGGGGEMERLYTHSCRWLWHCSGAREHT